MSENSNFSDRKQPICFVIMPISDSHDYESGHFGRVYEHLIKPAVIDAGYKPIRADDTNKTDYIVVGVIKRVVDSNMVLCDYSARNPNVMYELGIRHAFNLPVTLIKDRHTGKIFDIQGLRYTEYDHSLRVDSVQKDIKNISKAIKETATIEQSSFNSVVHLAGLKAAIMPEDQSISPDTQLILSAIGSLERRIESDLRSKIDNGHFQIIDDKVYFKDSSEAEIGEDLYQPCKGEIKPIGQLVDIHPSEEGIFVRREDGKIVPFFAHSVKSKGLSTIPF